MLDRSFFDKQKNKEIIKGAMTQAELAQLVGLICHVDYKPSITCVV